MIRSLLVAAAIAFAAGPALAQQAPAQQAAAEAAAPKFAVKTSTIGQILDSVDAKAALAKVMPEVAAAPQLEQARDMTIEAVAQIAPQYFPAEKLKELDAEFAKIK